MTIQCYSSISSRGGEWTKNCGVLCSVRCCRLDLTIFADFSKATVIPDTCHLCHIGTSHKWQLPTRCPVRSTVFRSRRLRRQDVGYSEPKSQRFGIVHSSGSTPQFPSHRARFILFGPVRELIVRIVGYKKHVGTALGKLVKSS